jgi:porin
MPGFRVTLLTAFFISLFAFAASGSLGAQECADTGDCCDVDSCFGPCDGGWCDSPTLTGDWGGLRSGPGGSGISTQLDVVNFYMGNTRGGNEKKFLYAGHGDYVFNFDGQTLVGMEGLSLKVRAEHRMGQQIGGAAGLILPPDLNAGLPTPVSEDLYVTNFALTQFLSPRFAVFLGKLDTLDGDLNAFASGRGKTQFLNAGMVVNPVNFRTFPYSTLGVGFLLLGENPEEIFTVSVLNATDTTRTIGLDELFARGVAIGAEYRIPTNFFNRPGHQLFGGTWNSREFATIDQDPRILLPEFPLTTANGSWSVYWNFDQYLHVDPCDPTKGWGLFGRAGIGDDKTNLVDYFLSAGIGGNSPLRGRSADTFGVGWFYSKTSSEINEIFATVIGGVGDSQGVELFYNYQVTPWFHLTPDIQVLVPGQQRFDTALLVGVRGVVTL